MKALPGRPAGASLLGASPLGASPRRCRFEDVALKLSLRCGWPSSLCRVTPCRILFLQGRSLQGRSPPALHQATGRALGQHSGGSIPAAAFRRLCFCSPHVGLTARRAHRTSGSSRVGRRLRSGVHPATGRNRRLDVPLLWVSRFQRHFRGSLGSPQESCGLFYRVCSAPLAPLGRGPQAALPSRLAFCGAAFCWAASREAASRGAVSRGAVSRRAVSRLF